MNSATNCGPRSEIALFGKPWCFQMFWTYSLARSFSDGVDHYHNCIFSFRLWQFDYKVNTDSVPRCVGDRERMKFSEWRLATCFGMQTHVACGDVMTDIS